MNDTLYDWTVIGAGPAGILALSKLIDLGIEPTNIMWLDPHFNVGDFGQKWKNVPGNTNVDTFLASLNEIRCISFNSQQFELFSLPKNATCQLSYMVEPLQFATNELLLHCAKQQGVTKAIGKVDGIWKISTDSDHPISTRNIILATGADPVTLPFDSTAEMIDIEFALDPEKLSHLAHANDHFAVFGSSHSAILVLKHLIELGVKEISNFYLSPCKYALPVGDWILYDNTGLKGKAAKWAKANLDGTLPPNLKRYLSTKENIALHLPNCTKRIDATGFLPRLTFLVEDLDPTTYDKHTGIIAQGMYGCGIAFPAQVQNILGQVELGVGIWKFSQHLSKVLPIWLAYSQR